VAQLEQADKKLPFDRKLKGNWRFDICYALGPRLKKADLLVFQFRELVVCGV
jgi:hypothetical protein